MKGTTLALLAVFLAAILGSAVVPLIKIGLQTIPPFAFTLLRFVIALVFILPIFLKEKPNIKNILEVVPVTLLSTINIILFILAVRFIPANIGTLIYVMVPIIVSILSYFVLNEKITWIKILGVLLGFLGSLILFFSSTVIGFSSLDNLVGIVLIFVGAVSYSFYLIFSKSLQKKYSPVYITSVFNLTTVLASLLFLPAELNLLDVNRFDISLVSVASILYVSVVGTSLYYLLGQYAVKYGSPVFSSLILYVQVPFTAIAASLLIGEKVTGNFWVAALFIVIGSLLVSKSNTQTIIRD
ncbi:hypothetical protein A2970_01900 [Candidatus Roizmanbacteria bacterium RIFCSPLOWO2_01_FULL_44_13]|uniref:EamA domain-containing protein n=1 Tax=Candidatus Roizmanbacteria bacterium RIFCSPLOWO2_01_FULL_44_13 TaxID=1802069 RepID=A0A1F7JBF0_9BACT|nr:MAG: hypothetical protein A2970_01900 [Candidatus Roizmanbacteria bacterium RIFCSPLOWO2_01_FULL_44_13]